MTAGYVLTADNAIYSRKAIADTRKAFVGFCAVNTTPLTGNRVELRFTVLPQHAENTRQVVLEFMNYALDRSLQLQLEETG